MSGTETSDIQLDTNDINDDINELNTHDWLSHISQLIVLINSKSGGKKGWLLGKEFTKYGAKIFDMLKVSKDYINIQLLGEQIYEFRDNCIIIIAGGDGSIAWGCSLIDKSLQYLKETKRWISYPYIVTFPVGTGNDLSRTIGWGNIEPSIKNLLKIMSDIHFCSSFTKRVSDMDRWRVTYTFDGLKPEKDKTITQCSINLDESKEYVKMKHSINELSVNNDIKDNNNNNNNNSDAGFKNIDDMFEYYGSQKQTPTHSFAKQKIGHMLESELTMNYALQNYPNSEINKYINSFSIPLPQTFLCYLSLGYDAQIAYNWGKERDDKPNLYSNQYMNQFMYIVQGSKDFFVPDEPINNKLRIYINNNHVPLPLVTRSFKLININCAMDGVFFWGNDPSNEYELQEWNHPRLDDKKIEVCCTRGGILII